MDLDGEVGTRIETPRQALRQERCDLSGRPGQKVAIRIDGGPWDQPFIAGGGIFLVKATRGRRPIDSDIGMVHHPRVAGMKFQSLHVPHAVDRYGNHEVTKDARAFGLQKVWLCECHDEIGFTKLPSIGERRRRRQIARIAFEGALVDPALNEIDLGGAQRMLPDEFAVVRLGFPRWHDAGFREQADLRRVLSHGGVGQHTEWTQTAGLVARSTSVEDERSNVLIEGHARCLRMGTGRRRADGCANERDQQANSLLEFLRHLFPQINRINVRFFTR